MSKIVLIGANHAGTAAANTILDNYPDNELVVFDRNSNISYLGCGTALWVGRQIDSPDSLFYSSKDILVSKNATVHMETEVKKVDFKAKKVYAVDKENNEICESYDKLILASGSLPIAPQIPGIDLENVQYVKLFQDAQKANACLEDDAVKNVAVIGAGYIGVELAEAIRRRGKNVMLFDTEDTCLKSYYDPWFTKDMDKILNDNGIITHYEQQVKELRGKNGKVSSVLTSQGEYSAELVVLAIGFEPNNILGKDDIALFENGAYKVNLKQETSIPDVYAIGDCATIYSNAIQDTTYIALATNAVRSGVVAAHNACGTSLDSIGVQGSNGICIYGYNMVSSGLNLEAAKKAGYNPIYTEYEDLQKPAFILDNQKVKLRIVYDKDTRRILGAQIASYENISMGIHMFSLAIEEQVTIDKLKLLDIFFLPHFNQPYNYITMAALTAK